MTAQTPSSPADMTACPDAPGCRRPWRWWFAMGVAFLMLTVLDWLLARLVWLPMYFGLFFFLVAGLLVGAAAFRLARSARPVARSWIATGVVLVAISASAVTVVWEYRNVAATVGSDRKFPDARNAAVAAGRPPTEVAEQATTAFVSRLRTDFPPGGPIGYVRWAIAAGEMDLTVAGSRDTVSIDHRGLIWPIRSSVGMLLLAAGLWLSVESLRRASPVSNVLLPGEEYEEDEEDE